MGKATALICCGKIFDWCAVRFPQGSLRGSLGQFGVQVVVSAADPYELAAIQ